MFFTLLRHAWMSFRRAHYFERNLGIKLVIGFVMLTLLWYVYLLARLLPGLLNQYFPYAEPHETFFSFLFLVYLSDLLLRLFVQKVPSHRVAPYLHLPVPRNRLASYLLIRSWASPFNFYLLVLFVPFFRQVFPAHEGAGLFWQVILGMWLLAAVNHAVLILLKTVMTPGRGVLAGMLLVAAVAGVGMGLFPDAFMMASRHTGLAIMQGHWAAFMLPVALIALMQYFAFRSLRQGLYPEVRQTTRKNVKEGLMSRMLAKTPRYGVYWVLEWKLLTRNKRSRNNLYQWPLILPFLIWILHSLIDRDNIGSAFLALLMFSGSYGFFHLQYVYSWESRFFDFIATRNMALRNFILAKYYFYSLMAIVQFLVMLPFILIVKPVFTFMFLSLMLYAIGPVFFILFYFGVSNSTRLDPNKRATFNFEGTSGSLFMTILLVFATFIPVAVVGLLLPWGAFQSILMVTAFTGLAFSLSHQWWAGVVESRFEKNKYKNLDKYREQ
jgi:hypothetical protein